MIAVWFSCGAASAVAAKLTIREYGHAQNIRVIYNPVKEEDEDNLRFMKDIQDWIGIDIELAWNNKFPSCSASDVWADRKFMSSPYGAPCTGELKKEARRQWEEANKPDWHVLGYTVDEKHRHDRFVLTERSNLLPVLIDARLTKQDCLEILLANDIEPPRVYGMGYPNANCIGCVKATSPTYWNHVRNTHPNVFAARARQSREIGCKLAKVKNERIHLDELPEDATGSPLKSLSFKCGIFCEEYRETV